MFQAYIDVHANKRDSILFSYFHGEFQVSVARVQFVKKSNSFIEIRHNGQAVTHVALIEGGELAHFLLIIFSSTEHMNMLANNGPRGEAIATPSICL